MISLEKRIRALENGIQSLKVAYGTTGANTKTYQVSRTFRLNVSVPPATSSGPSVSTIKIRFVPSAGAFGYVIVHLSASVQRISGVSPAYWGSHQAIQNVGGVSEIDVPFSNYDRNGSLAASYDITVFASSTVPGTLSLVE